MPTIPNIDITPPKYGTNFADELYKMIRGIPQAYQEGAEGAFKRGQFARTEKLQAPYDIPLDANGQPDTNKMLSDISKTEGISGAKDWLNTILQQRSASDVGEALRGFGNRGGQGGTSDVERGDIPPTIGHPPAPANIGGQGPVDRGGPSATDPRGKTNLRQLMLDRGIDPNSLTPEIRDTVAQEFAGLGPGGIDRSLPDSVAAGVGKKLDNLAGAGLFGVPTGSAGSGGAPGAGAAPGGGRVVQAPLMPGRGGQPPMAQPAPSSFGDRFGAAPGPQVWPATPAGTIAQAQELEKRATFLRSLMNRPNLPPGTAKMLEEEAKTTDAQAKFIREQSSKYAEPTTEQRNAPPGMNVQQAEAYKGALGEQAKAAMEPVAAALRGIGPARDSMKLLYEMRDAIQSSNGNITTGPGARQILDLKRAINNVMPGTFKNVAEAETVDKLNAQLASALVKAMTPRPTQFEFKQFSNTATPGLFSSPQGTDVLIDLLLQGKKQELELAGLADRFDPMRQKWTDVERQYYATHHIISPFTGYPVEAQKAKDGKWYIQDNNGRYLEVNKSQYNG